jgi:hypothetical protein
VSTSTAAAVLAKIAGLGTAAKTALGLVVATGVVGALTAIPAMAESGDHPAAPLPGASATAEPTEAPEPSETAEPSEDATEAPRPAPTDLPSAAAFGQSVAADARDGGVDGQQISDEAHARNDLRKANHEADNDADNDADEATEPQPEPTHTWPAAVPTSDARPGTHTGDRPEPTALPTHP